MAQSNRQGERGYEKGKGTQSSEMGRCRQGWGRRRLSKTGKEMQRPRGKGRKTGRTGSQRNREMGGGGNAGAGGAINKGGR